MCSQDKFISEVFFSSGELPPHSPQNVMREELQDKDRLSYFLLHFLELSILLSLDWPFSSDVARSCCKLCESRQNFFTLSSKSVCQWNQPE